MRFDGLFRLLVSIYTQQQQWKDHIDRQRSVWLVISHVRKTPRQLLIWIQLIALRILKSFPVASVIRYTFLQPWHVIKMAVHFPIRPKFSTFESQSEMNRQNFHLSLTVFFQKERDSNLPTAAKSSWYKIRHTLRLFFNEEIWIWPGLNKRI